MSQSEKEQKGSSVQKIIIILMIVIIVALIAFTSVLLLKKDSDTQGDLSAVDSSNAAVPTLTYESGAVALSEDDLQRQVDEMYEKAKEGTMALQFKNTAYSSDGVHFDCHIGNSDKNDTDMYLNIYKDDALTEQILLTGLIPPGSGIESFESEIKLDPGTYETYLVFTQVKDDHATIKAQVTVILTLVVSE
ncbi:MAG: hypothetical protein LUI05_09850 [Oscillospiraceae bacterium]|nr:hypothetical protein [Oscillospiraceae bacterium]